MNLPFRYCLITLFTFVLASKNLAQPHHTYYRTIGDAAPPLNCGNWLKGKPINSFKKGEIYVLEFWATWCHPCIASMPHLSEMANTYKNKATFIGISVLEFKPVSIQKIKKFVDSMGTKMNFQIALDKNDFMVKYWLNYNEQSGIPKTFVINENGKIAWIGHPSKLGQVLPQIVNHTWDIKKELANLIEEKRMETLDRSLDHQIDSIYYRGKSQIGNELNLLDTSKANAVLSLIETSIMYEPKLRYRYSTGYNIFTALLATNLKNAFAFGVNALNDSPLYDDMATYNFVKDIILRFKNDFHLPLTKEIYGLGAKAYCLKIADCIYPEITDLPRWYHRMAVFHNLAGNKNEAIKAEEKAIEILNSRKPYDENDMKEYKEQLKIFAQM